MCGFSFCVTSSIPSYISHHTIRVIFNHANTFSFWSNLSFQINEHDSLGYGAQLALWFSNHNSQSLLNFFLLVFVHASTTCGVPCSVVGLSVKPVYKQIHTDPQSKLTTCAVQWCGVSESTRNETLASMWATNADRQGCGWRLKPELPSAAGPVPISSVRVTLGYIP